MADEGIRRLQAELQEVYRSAAKQKLSERNVVELVSKLIELRLVDVLYTTDGKTYLTHQQLNKEIRDELIVNGGRISLVDLQQIVNVDYTHVEAKVNEMVKHDPTLTFVLGQLIDNNYRQRLAEEINDVLHEKGHVTIMDLTKSHDLPADFLREVIMTNLGKVIKGKVDEYDQDMVFTDAFLARMKARIRGALSAVTVPTAIGPVRQAIGCKEHLFHSILEELVSQGRLAGMLSGSRQDKSQFLPEIYTRAQNEWVDNFFKQNGYLEYDALSRLGIGDAKGYIKKRFKSESLVFLSTCCVGPSIYDGVECGVEEALAGGGWLDVTTILPSVLSQKDASELISRCLKTKGPAIVCDQTIVASERLVTESVPTFTSLMVERAEKTSKSHPAMTQSSTSGGGEKTGKLAAFDDGGTARDDKKDQRRKKAATAGSTKKEGTGGREVKMKSTKKKGRGREVEVDSDDERHGPGPSSSGKSQDLPFTFMAIPEIEEVLRKQTHLADCPPDLISEIAAKLHRPLQREYQDVAKSIFLKASTGSDRKRSAQEVQDKVNGLWTNAHLFERGTRQFKDQAVEGQLVKHLLKTVCSDLANTLVIAIASDNMVSTPEDEDHLTPEARMRLVSAMPKVSQEPLGRLLTHLNGTSLEDYFGQVETLCGPDHLGLLLKKPDKRKERQLIFNHRQCLAEQLRTETDAAMTLHLSSVLLFQTFTQCMLHVPGRLVPIVINQVSSHLETEKMVTLSTMQDLVVRHARYKSDPEVYSEEEVEAVIKEMNAIVDKVKDIALTTKKGAATADE